MTEPSEPLSPDRRKLLLALGFGAANAIALSRISKSGRPTVTNVRPRAAANFYGVIVVAMVIGMVLNFAHLDPKRLRIWAAVVNGLMAPPLIVIILVVCNNRRVMGEHRNGWALNLIGGAAAAIMGGAAVMLIFSLF